ncbi:tRNA (guanosine(37)-N1)-methyltransferase TrmD [Brevibacterium yomogidense]|uniref:tRNA (guanosine(37)-N1)-methyltransferase TrmD n=1 Tax=Brevibacterium yomogidense TaxID=946573 RepID=UPI0018DFBD47|nr:tRNA (guanosine(37)-N1)-methyltransferase TrmD [Brevibacterium yomogidense]
MRLDVFSIFPEYLAPLDLSLIGRAREKRLLDLTVHDLREWTHDRHRTVDDTPYGGGAGMVMKPEPWGEALDTVLSATPDVPVAEVSPSGESVAGASSAGEPVAEVPAAEDSAAAVRARPVLIVPSPAGEVFTQTTARELASRDHLVFACGRYEGIDQRVIDWASQRMEVRPMSIGDYVLNGGEVAVLAMVEAIARLLPGVIGNPGSLDEESHEDGLLEYPVYTKPATWRGLDVPSILLSGDHGKVARWRRDQRLRRTAATRPDLLAVLPAGSLDARDSEVLREATTGAQEEEQREAGSSRVEASGSGLAE